MKKGFTLAEVLIVIIIIAVLGAIALPRYGAQTNKARVGEALNMMGAIRRGAEALFDATDSYTGDDTGVINSLALTANTNGVVSGNWSKLGISGMDRKKSIFYAYDGFYYPAVGNAVLSNYQICAGYIKGSGNEGTACFYAAYKRDGTRDERWECSGIFKYANAADQTAGRSASACVA